MNITQRKYTFKRLEDLHKTKTLALLRENDAVIEAHNTRYTVSAEEAKNTILKHPILLSYVENNSTYNQLSIEINWKLMRELLNKPAYTLEKENARNYLYDKEKEHGVQTICQTVFGSRIVLNLIDERITKLNHRIAYAKDQVMIGDAQKALDALEEINSLVF